MTAKKKQLEITISPSGEVEVKVKCIPGASCLEETKFLEAALGNEIKTRDLTGEYYQQAETQEVTNKTGG